MKREYKFFILARVLYLYGSQGFKDPLKYSTYFVELAH